MCANLLPRVAPEAASQSLSSVVTVLGASAPEQLHCVGSQVFKYGDQLAHSILVSKISFYDVTYARLCRGKRQLEKSVWSLEFREEIGKCLLNSAE